MDVALASCQVLPEPDPDETLLLDALSAAGLVAGSLAWDDPAVDWSVPAMTLLRATWNYPRHAEAFGTWLAAAASRTELWNPLPVVRWNLHKRYLLELEAAGVAVTPTLLVAHGTARSTLRVTMEEAGWEDAVVKPAVGAASHGARRVAAGDDAEAAEAHLAQLLEGGDVLVQPYLQAVEGHGERALIWIDGALTHAVRKTPRFAGEDEAVSDAVPISPAEARLARHAVEVALRHGPILYARIDVVPGPAGEPVVMELELIEPSLFFRQGPAALERLTSAVVRRRRQLDDHPSRRERSLPT